MKSKTKGFLALLAASLTFGTFGIWVRLLSTVLISYQQIVFRNFFALLFCLIVIVAKKIDWRVVSKISKTKLFSFMIFVPLSVIFYVFSITSEKISVVTFAFYGGTIISSWLLGILFLKERIEMTGKLSIIFVFIGLLIMNYPLSLNNLSIGFLLALLSGSLDGFANYLRKTLGGAIDKFILVLSTSIGGVMISGLMTIVSKNSLLFFQNLELNIWLIGAFFGLLLVLVNFLLLFGFQNFNVGLGSVVLSAELFFAVIFAVIVFNEWPSRNEIIGGVLIFLAATLPSLGNVIFEKNEKSTNS